MTATTSNAPPAVLALAPLMVSGATAAKLLGISPRSFRRLEVSGMLGPRPILVGRLRRFRVLDLGEWVRAGLPSRRRWELELEERGERPPAAAQSRLVANGRIGGRG